MVLALRMFRGKWHVNWEVGDSWWGEVENMAVAIGEGESKSGVHVEGHPQGYRDPPPSTRDIGNSNKESSK